MRWLRCTMALTVATTAAASLPVTASAHHDRVSAAAPPNYTQSVNSGVDDPAGQQASASAVCPTGTVVWGGGVAETLSDPAGASLSVSSPTAKTGWFGRANNPTSDDSSFSVDAQCAKKPAGYAIVVKAVTDKPGSPRGATATCPAGTVVIGGGADSGSTSLAGLLVSSWPSSTTTFAGYMNNGSPTAAKLQVFAICATQPPGYTITSHAANNPPGASTTSVACPAGSVDVGGGVSLTVHGPSIFVIGSTPDGSAGWQGTVSNGNGVPIKGKVYAICAS